MSEHEDKLYAYFFQAIRAGGGAPPIGGMDQLQTAIRNITGIVKDIAKFEAGEIANQIQENIKTSFKSVEADVASLEKKVEDLEEEVARLWDRGEEENEE